MIPKSSKEAETQYNLLPIILSPNSSFSVLKHTVLSVTFCAKGTNHKKNKLKNNTANFKSRFY